MRRGASAALLGASLVLAACGGPPDGAPDAGDGARPNVLLISIDTLRADHLHCYGYERDTSPNIDRLARGSTRYAQVYAPAPWTLPSHATMMTGIHGFDLGLRDGTDRIPETVPMLAELLRAHGYQTAAFVDSRKKGFVGAERGFDRGFDVFEHAPHRDDLVHLFDAAVTMDEGLAWLRDRDPERPFFLFLHTKAVHAVPEGRSGKPTEPPYFGAEPHYGRYLDEAQREIRWGSEGKPKASEHLRATNLAFAAGLSDRRAYAEERAAALAALYDGGIRAMDAEVGRFLAELERAGLADSTVLVLTSDHGEAFLEHHFLLHVEVYNDLLHVPLILRVPGEAGGRVVETPVGLEDLAPTLLELAGVPVPPEVAGSVLPRENAPAAERRFFGYRHRLLRVTRPFYTGFSLQRGDWKLVYHRIGAGEWQSELYHVAEDPEETRPVETEPELEQRYRGELLEWVGSRASEAEGPVKLDPDTLEHLRALGYAL